MPYTFEIRYTIAHFLNLERAPNPRGRNPTREVFRRVHDSGRSQKSVGISGDSILYK